MNVVSMMFELLRFDLFETELCADIKNAITLDNLPDLYKLSKKHDLVHIISDALDKNGLLENEKAKIAFLQERIKAISRSERQQYELDEICKALEEAKISFVPLKGSVIRALYPQPWMRTSCDIDILVKEDSLEATAQYLCDKLGYDCKFKRSINALSLNAPSGVHLELHYDLTEGDRFGKEVLSHIWDYTTLKEGYQYWYLLNDDAFYFYHIAHMVKHFESGGCGVRPFLDLWFLDNLPQVDLAKRDALLEEGKLLKFANACRKLSCVWFGKDANNDVSKQLEDYILRGGVYGNVENRIAVQQQKKGGRFKYVMSKIFVPYKILKIHYPILEKHRYLMPFMQVRRWFKLLFRGNLKNTSKDIKYSNSITTQQAEKMQTFLKDLGLK